MAVSGKDRAVGLIAIVLYLAVGVLPYLGSGLVVPLGAVPVLWGVWLVGLAVCVRLVGRTSEWALGAAPAVLLFWVLFVQAGSFLFGWTA